MSEKEENNEVFDQLLKLRREFPELSRAAIMQIWIDMNTEPEEECDCEKRRE